MSQQLPRGFQNRVTHRRTKSAQPPTCQNILAEVNELHSPVTLPLAMVLPRNVSITTAEIASHENLRHTADDRPKSCVSSSSDNTPMEPEP